MKTQAKENKIVNVVAAVLLLLMFLFGYFSLRGDSTTMDELAHIPAGYSYITQQDMRLNPEHPPLLKDAAGFSIWLNSLIFDERIVFPDQTKAWQTDRNGQWDFGREFLYRFGNDADQIVLWARLPMLLLTLLLGLYVFKWTRQLYGNGAGLLALTIFTFSPTILAHGRYVTTDVGAAAAFFIATYYLIKWLKNQTKSNLIWAGIVFGIAMLIKFSLVLIVPYFIIVVIFYAFVQSLDGHLILSNKIKKLKCRLHFKEFLATSVKKLILLFLIGLIGLALIYPVYLFHTWNYPPQRQFSDTQETLASMGNRPAAELTVAMSKSPILRPYAQYLMGLFMVMQRTVGGNTTYFLGQVDRNAWWYYFPVVYLIKEPLAFHILTLIALLYAAARPKEAFYKKTGQRICLWLKRNFVEVSMLIFLVIYWTVSIRSNLNIGVRHVLPVFPFMYVLVSGQISKWLKVSWLNFHSSKSIVKKIKAIGWLVLTSYLKYVVIFVLIGWYILSSISIYPHYLAYFNEAVGGSKEGYKYANDSNLDWGQDLKRLYKWKEEYNKTANQPIGHLYIDYFGGSIPEYYFGQDFWPWWGSRSPQEIKPGEFLAVSSTFLQGGRAVPARGFNEPTTYYMWLNQQKLVDVIGYSIFIYQIQ